MHESRNIEPSGSDRLKFTTSTQEGTHETNSNTPTMPPTQSVHEDDPFDSLLTLEDTLYTSAYDQGVADGARAGRVEGRIFGLENGFEKFAELGELHGRAVVWGGRVSAFAAVLPGEKRGGVGKEQESQPFTENKLPDLPSSSRLQNNISLLHSLTDLETFSTDNTEEAVADFDDRFKRAGAKAKVIERIVGESSANAKSLDGVPGSGHNVRLEGEKKGRKGDDSMEDFMGSKLLR